MKQQRWGRLLLIMLAGAAILSAAGCSRESMNYQIAESIGTLGMFENNEPVETPKMREEREHREALEAEENTLLEELAQADALAASCLYDEAVAFLEKCEKTENTAGRIQEAIERYQSAKNSLRNYSGDVGHLCFPTLIEDTMRAFDGDQYSSQYSGTMVTTTEFKRILEELYAHQYILVDIQDVARLETDNRGITTMEFQQLRLPEGKRPIIISQDNVNYSGVRNGDGIATRLELDADGKVKARYTDDGGHDLVGDYDLIPILDAFIEEHPDFSYRGARGIVSVSASEGVFGYEIQDSLLSSDEENRSRVSAIAEALKAEGWRIACAGYSHGYLNDLSAEQLQSEMDQWKETAGALTGDSDILFYPYGAEVTYPSDQLKVLLAEGFVYLCGLWGDTDFMEIGDGYLRQTRRFVDGYTLVNAGSYFTGYFDASAVRDSDR